MNPRFFKIFLIKKAFVINIKHLVLIRHKIFEAKEAAERNICKYEKNLKESFIRCYEIKMTC